MRSLLGFEIGMWDYLAFAAILLLGGAGLMTVVFLLGLPGKIAIARKHPEAEAVSMMGWLGFLAVVPWMQAFMWAFKPTDVIDIRRLPREEQRDIEEEIAKLKGTHLSKPALQSSEQKTGEPVHPHG